MEQRLGEGCGQPVDTNCWGCQKNKECSILHDQLFSPVKHDQLFGPCNDPMVQAMRHINIPIEIERLALKNKVVSEFLTQYRLGKLTYEQSLEKMVYCLAEIGEKINEELFEERLNKPCPDFICRQKRQEILKQKFAKGDTEEER